MSRYSDPQLFAQDPTIACELQALIKFNKQFKALVNAGVSIEKLRHDGTNYDSIRTPEYLGKYAHRLVAYTHRIQYLQTYIKLQVNSKIAIELNTLLAKKSAEIKQIEADMAKTKASALAMSSDESYRAEVLSGTLSELRIQQSHLTEQVKSLTKENKALTARVNELENTVKKLQDNIKSLEESKTVLTTTTKTLRKDVKNLKLKTKKQDRQIQSLESDVVIKNDEIKTLKSEVAENYDLIQNLQTEVTEQNDLIDEQDERINALETDIAVKGKQINALEADGLIKDEKINNLESDIADKGNSIEKLESLFLQTNKLYLETNKQLVETNAKLVETNKRLEENDRKWQVKYDNMVNHFNAEIAEVRGRLDNLEAQMKALHTDTEAFKVKVNELAAPLSTEEKQEVVRDLANIVALSYSTIANLRLADPQYEQRRTWFALLKEVFKLAKTLAQQFGLNVKTHLDFMRLMFKSNPC